MEEINLNDYYTPAEVAEVLSVTSARIVQIIAEGRLKGRKISNKFWLIEKKSADDYIEAVTKVRGK